jgi:hypothetical protein
MFAKIKNFAKKRKFGLRVRIDPVGFILGLSQSKSLQKKKRKFGFKDENQPKGCQTGPQIQKSQTKKRTTSSREKKKRKICTRQKRKWKKNTSHETDDWFFFNPLHQFVDHHW